MIDGNIAVILSGDETQSVVKCLESLLAALSDGQRKKWLTSQAGKVGYAVMSSLRDAARRYETGCIFHDNTGSN